VIIKNISNSLEFKKISTEVAREIVITVESNYDFVFNDESESFHSYMKMMTTDDNFLQMTAIISLKKTMHFHIVYLKRLHSHTFLKDSFLMEERQYSVTFL
jgi:hypothetical protein